jgi:hypothetical protein
MFFPFNLRNKFEDGAPVSEFTRDYKKYNYTIDNEDDWINLDTGITKKSAIKLATEMNNLVIDKWRVSGWRSNTYYNLGKEIDEIRNILVKNGNSFLINSKDQFILGYIKLYKDYYRQL